MQRLVDDLLDASRIRRGRVSLQLVAHDLREDIRAARETLTHQGRRARIDLTLPSSLVVFGDQGRLRQVFQNLLDNAAKHSPKEVTVEVHGWTDDTAVIVEVRDHGQGLSDEDLEHVFQFFEQGERGSEAGLGIGLALVQSLIELHEGTVTARSDGPGKGSVFTVRLPRHPVRAPGT